ncbi:unnamed protein product [Durusdinium trenchii]|uniref:Uncharacterized protein n=1 Tax=Durusdinium trenchii TaxID=1381693 RepID=A0ABP0QU05_9DINO
MLSPQQNTLYYALPSLAILAACVSPFVLFAVVGGAGNVPAVTRASLRAPLSLVSLLIIFLSLVFFLSNYRQPTRASLDCARDLARLQLVEPVGSQLEHTTTVQGGSSRIASDHLPDLGYQRWFLCLPGGGLV